MPFIPKALVARFWNFLWWMGMFFANFWHWNWVRTIYFEFWHLLGHCVLDSEEVLLIWVEIWRWWREKKKGVELWPGGGWRMNARLEAKQPPTQPVGAWRPTHLPQLAKHFFAAFGFLIIGRPVSPHPPNDWRPLICQGRWLFGCLGL